MAPQSVCFSSLVIKQIQDKQDRCNKLLYILLREISPPLQLSRDTNCSAPVPSFQKHPMHMPIKYFSISPGKKKNQKQKQQSSGKVLRAVVLEREAYYHRTLRLGWPPSPTFNPPPPCPLNHVPQFHIHTVLENAPRTGTPNLPWADCSNTLPLLQRIIFS